MVLAIDRARTCLVVIDLQNGIVASPTEPHDVKMVVANAAALAGAFRANGMPVYLVHVVHSKGTGLRPIADDSMFPKSELPREWEDIVPEMGPKPGDIVIPKRQWGAFYGTDLELRLRRGGLDTMVICGISTSMGVESTARFAFEYGFQVVFAEDAMADRIGAAHQNSIELIFTKIGRVRKTAEILAALGA